MKSIIFYFSGTGNTEIVVKKWKEAAQSFSYEIDLFKIESDDLDSIDLKSYDKIGFAYPIHAFNAPRNVWQFAKKLPVLEEKKELFVIMVSGEFMTINHSSARKLNGILKKKNIIITSDYHYIMPYNMIFRHTEKRAYIMYDTMCKLVPIDVKEYLIDNKPYKLEKHAINNLIIPIFRIEQWFAPINGKMFKINSKKCIKCMKCVKNCPTQNIKFQDGKFKFENRCVLCTRCSFNCPTDAFSIAILNNWRVNKPYRFEMPEEEEVDKHKNFCKKSYARYFAMAQQRIENSKD